MERERKFTSGTWEIKPEECGVEYIRLRGTQLGGRYKIANVITPSYLGVHERELVETRANANLISAAPDLLAALEGIQDRFNHLMEISDGVGDKTFLAGVLAVVEVKSRAAISKAYGIP